MNRSDTRKQVTPGFAGMRKDDDGDYDETDSGGWGKVDMPQQAARAFGMSSKAGKMDELDEGADVRRKGGRMDEMDEGSDVRKDGARSMRSGPAEEDAEEDDEGITEGPVPVKNAPSHAMRDAVTNRADEDAEEASEMRQKGGNMGGKGMKAGGGKIQGTEISDADEMKGSAHKVTHGREKPAGHEAEIEGAHQGSGMGREPAYFSNLGHGEREAKISGAHQGQHGNTMETDGGGFEASGRLSKEHARGPSGTKR
jgi:hypothetical protein